MTAETRWVSSTFAYLYLIFSKLTFQPLSLGDSFTRKEMKRLSGGKSVSSLFFVPSKNPDKTPQKTHSVQPSLEELQLEKLGYQAHAGRLCLLNLHLFSHGFLCWQPARPTKQRFLLARNPVLLRNTPSGRACSHLRGLLLGEFTRSPSKFKRKAWNDSRGRASGHPGEARAIISGLKKKKSPSRFLPSG